MSDTAIMLEDIYQQFDVETALPELSPKKRGKYYQLACPTCEKREAFIYDGSHTITCNRTNNCGQSVSLWDYVTQRDGLQTAQETLQRLAALAGYDLPQTLDRAALERVKTAQAHTSLLEAAHSIFMRTLSSEAGKKELEYLHKRGYTADDITTMQLGAIPPINSLNKQLKDETVNNVNIVNTKIDELQTVGFGSTHTLAIPHRDYRGRLIGFIARTVSEAEPKYKYSKGLTVGEQFFNLDKNKGEKKLVVVEGTLDALLATAM